MLKGDISNEVAPRLLFIFEGLIATPPKEQRRFSLRRRGPIDGFEIDVQVLRWAWHFSWQGMTIDVFTFIPEASEDIEKLLDRHQFPYGSVLETTTSEISRHYANNPAVAAIFDPSPDRRFLYGSKGRSELVL